MPLQEPYAFPVHRAGIGREQQNALQAKFIRNTIPQMNRQECRVWKRDSALDGVAHQEK